MRRIALINQKGGVGKTTTTANLGAALAEAGRRVLVLDLDPQANLSMHFGVEIAASEPSTYSVLLGEHALAEAIRPVSENLFLVPSLLDLSGAEMELAGAIGRETLLRDALDSLAADSFDYLLIDCPPSLGLLSVNGLTAANEAFITLQTEFFALQGMSKLVEVVQLLRRRLHPDLRITGILPCLYDPRLRLAREVLAEIRRYFPGQVFRTTIRTNVKLAEAPSYGLSILAYAPDSNGAADYRAAAREVLSQETGTPLESPEPELSDDPSGDLDEAPSASEAAAAGEAPPVPPAPPSSPQAMPEPPASPARAPILALDPARVPEPPAAPAAAPASVVPEPGLSRPEPSSRDEDLEAAEVTEYVLVPGQGLRPVPRTSQRPVPRATDLPQLPEEAFGPPRDV